MIAIRRVSQSIKESFAVYDLAFYDAGCHEPRGIRRAFVPARRLLRRLLRPVFLRQVALFQNLIERLDAGEESIRVVRSEFGDHVRRLDELEEQAQAIQAFGWDYVAMGRRMAVLEDQLA